MDTISMQVCKVGEILREYNYLQEQQKNLSDMLAKAVQEGRDTTELLNELDALTRTRDKLLRTSVWSMEKIV